ncbi:hypothetical protein SAMN04487911_10727 [Arenibacter nanhaiticus]|uniref:Uncharacterized protein n=1 Tax=Arenibacter nanhaiticus TaxID=558155 RepID=A0A1M6ERP5_9FLAO|nr:hypothetical protein SAMN04487911_10727 [Arenibacter nanhaiticus]
MNIFNNELSTTENRSQKRMTICEFHMTAKKTLEIYTYERKYRNR